MKSKISILKKNSVYRIHMEPHHMVSLGLVPVVASEALILVVTSEALDLAHAQMEACVVQDQVECVDQDQKEIFAVHVLMEISEVQGQRVVFLVLFPRIPFRKKNSIKALKECMGRDLAFLDKAQDQDFRARSSKSDTKKLRFNNYFQIKTEQ